MSRKRMISEERKSKSKNIPVYARRRLARIFGLEIGKISDSKPAYCNNCGREGTIENNGFGYIYLSRNLNFDHIEPHRVSGNTDTYNFQVLCTSCNQVKRSIDLQKYPLSKYPLVKHG